MEKSSYFLIIWPFFILSTLGSFLTRYSANPKYFTRIRQENNFSAISERKFQNDWNVKAFQNKNFVRNFGTRGEKFFIASKNGNRPDVEIFEKEITEFHTSTSKLLNNPKLSPMQSLIVCTNHYHDEKITILAIPKVTLNREIILRDRELSDLEISNLIMEILGEDPEFLTIDADWFAVNRVNLNGKLIGPFLVRKRKSTSSIVDFHTIARIIIKSEFGLMWFREENDEKL